MEKADDVSFLLKIGITCIVALIALIIFTVMWINCKQKTVDYPSEKCSHSKSCKETGSELKECINDCDQNKSCIKGCLINLCINNCKGNKECFKECNNKWGWLKEECERVECKEEVSDLKNCVADCDPNDNECVYKCLLVECEKGCNKLKQEDCEEKCEEKWAWVYKKCTHTEGLGECIVCCKASTKPDSTERNECRTDCCTAFPVSCELEECCEKSCKTASNHNNCTVECIRGGTCETPPPSLVHTYHY